MARARNEGAASQAAPATVQLLEPVEHDGVLSMPGAWLELPLEAAAALVAQGAAISKADAEAAQAGTDDVSQSS